MVSSKVLIAGLAAAVLVLSIACGGDDSDGNAGLLFALQATEAAEATEATEASSGDGDSGLGSGTLTIGEDSWTFDLNRCFFEGEFFDETVLFSVSGSVAIPGNGMLGFTAAIQDSTLPGEDLSHIIFVFSFIGDNGEAVKEDIRWSAEADLFAGEDAIIQVDGKRVTGEALFDNDMTSETESVPGTLAVICP